MTADDGFTCIEPGSVLDVYEDEGGLYVWCDKGKHHLKGQLLLRDPPGSETLVGLTKTEEIQ